MFAVVLACPTVREYAGGMSKKLQRQHRVVPAQVRATPDGVEGRFVATVLRYNVVDDYDTVFLPGVFDGSLARRMPRIVWAHDWAEPLGRWTGRELSDDSVLRLVGEMDDFDAVPQARRAWAQMQSGTIDQFSVGFMPEEAQPVIVESREVLGFTRGRLDEVSLVLVGAVPGTELLSMRAGRILVREPGTAVLDVEAAGGLLHALAGGEITLAEALATAQAQAQPVADDPPTVPVGEAADEPPAAAADEPVVEPAGEPTGDVLADALAGNVADTEAAVAAAAEAERLELQAQVDAALGLVDELAL
jgi:HK97 family phage prohead protease